MLDFTATDSVEFDPAPAGPHAAVCTQAADLGTHSGQFGPKRQVRLGFEIAAKMEDGRPFFCQRTYTASFNSKATLRQDLESWRGAKFAEGEKFALGAVVGKPCMLILVHETKGDRTYSNIKTISQLPAGMPAPEPQGPLVQLDLDKPGWADALANLPEFLKKIILESPEAQGEAPEKPASPQQHAAVAAAQAPQPVRAPTGTVGPELATQPDPAVPFDDPLPDMGSGPVDASSEPLF